jgi:hypothetical protein
MWKNIRRLITRPRPPPSLMFVTCLTYLLSADCQVAIIQPTIQKLNTSAVARKGRVEDSWMRERAAFVPVAYRGGVISTSHPPKFRSFAKAEPNSQFREIYIRNNLIRIWVSFICKLSGTPDQGATAPISPFSLPSMLN